MSKKNPVRLVTQSKPITKETMSAPTGKTTKLPSTKALGVHSAANPKNGTATKMPGH